MVEVSGMVMGSFGGWVTPLITGEHWSSNYLLAGERHDSDRMGRKGHALTHPRRSERTEAAPPGGSPDTSKRVQRWPDRQGPVWLTNHATFREGFHHPFHRCRVNVTATSGESACNRRNQTN